MNSLIFSVFLAISCFICLCTSDQLSMNTNTSGGIKSGLKADTNDFVLNGRKLHYFPVLCITSG